MDRIAHEIERIQTFFMWMEEHRASFENLRFANPTEAESELEYLRDAIEQGAMHLQRLIELLGTGSSSKSWPRFIAAVVERRNRRLKEHQSGN